MRIVLDTNVLVSALLTPASPTSAFLAWTTTGVLQLCYDVRILQEYRDVLSRPKFRFDTDYVDVLLSQIESDGVLVLAPPLACRLPDPYDEPFLAVALAADARCLVTGNVRDYPSDSCQGMSVVTPREFLDDYYRQTDSPNAG